MRKPLIIAAITVILTVILFTALNVSSEDSSKIPLNEAITEITIVGDDLFVNRCQDAITLLHAHAYYELLFVLEHIDEIKLTPDTDHYGYVDRVNKIFYVSDKYDENCNNDHDYGDLQSGADWLPYVLAGGMVHEATHVWIYDEYLQEGKNKYSEYMFDSRLEEERYCVTRQIETLKLIGAPEWLVRNYELWLENIESEQWW